VAQQWFRKLGTVAIVEAEQYEGRDELFVQLDEFSGTTAHRGDWLVKDKHGETKAVVREKDWASQYEPSPHPRTVKIERNRRRREREAGTDTGDELEDADDQDQDDDDFDESEDEAQEDAEMAQESGAESKHADADERTGPGEKPVSLPEDDRGAIETDEQDDSADARGGVVRPEGEEEEPTRRGA
jgi:hypothetical protein